MVGAEEEEAEVEVTTVGAEEEEEEEEAGAEETTAGRGVMEERKAPQVEKAMEIERAPWKERGQRCVRVITDRSYLTRMPRTCLAKARGVTASRVTSVSPAIVWAVNREDAVTPVVWPVASERAGQPPEKACPPVRERASRLTPLRETRRH